MKIGIGNDHAGVQLKKIVIEHLKEKGIEYIDYGAQEGEKVDYPVPGRAVAEAVIKGEVDKGILICGTGIGISLAANKVPGIRAAVCSDTYCATKCVEHNNANCVAFGARVVGEGVALDIVDAYLAATFQGERHQRRIDLITKIEEDYSKPMHG